jgi:hypothetical protein
VLREQISLISKQMPETRQYVGTVSLLALKQKIQVSSPYRSSYSTDIAEIKTPAQTHFSEKIMLF